MSPTVGSAPITDMVAIEHEISDRIVRTLVFVLPPAAVVAGGWLAWGGELYWQDLLLLAIMYALTGLGITVGFHRLFTHRSFKTGRVVRVGLAVLGSMAVEGPVIEWVATHRKHHRFPYGVRDLSSVARRDENKRRYRSCPEPAPLVPRPQSIPADGLPAGVAVSLEDSEQ